VAARPEAHVLTVLAGGFQSAFIRFFTAASSGFLAFGVAAAAAAVIFVPRYLGGHRLEAWLKRTYLEHGQFRLALLQSGDRNSLAKPHFLG
jgi:hypothetical protein